MTWCLKLGPSLHFKENMKFEVQPHKTTLSNIDVVNKYSGFGRHSGSLHHTSDRLSQTCTYVYVMTWGLKLGPSLHVKENKKFEVQPHKTTLSNIDVVNDIQRIWPTFGLITSYKWQIDPNLHLCPRNDLMSQTWSEFSRQRK